LSSTRDSIYPHHLPRAFAPLAVSGVVRANPDDFVVDERAVHAEDHGEHLLLRIEKRDCTTPQVAAALAVAFGVEPVDVSYAGMKDRHAVTRQWFSIRTPASPRSGVGGAGWRILESRRRPTKLRRGDLAGNAFSIRLRAISGDVGQLAQRIATLSARGVPNYFGEQRFGRCAGNIERARFWLTARRPRPQITAFQRGLHLSTARALLFNAVLAARVTADSWGLPLAGDVLIDGVPTAPLWGRGRSESRGDAAAVEQAVLAPYCDWLAPLEHVGLRQQRRPLVALPGGLRCAMDGDTLQLDFELAAGQYATALLRELGDWRNTAGQPR
jgi:tRNA pseudouridine13 synthase